MIQKWAINAPVKIIWIGPGYGLAEVPKEKRDGYKTITQRMVESSHSTFTNDVKAFNIFAAQNKFDHEIGNKVKQEEKIREHLKKYIESKDPMKLPPEMRAGPPQEEKWEDNIKVCQACQKRGHCHITCQREEGKQESEGEIPQMWRLVQLLTMEQD
jgi:hypothetical protein